MPDTEHQALKELLPAHALGALDGDELRRLESHLAAGCLDCRRQLAAWNHDLELLAAAGEPVEPSARVREALLARVAGTLPPATSQPPRRPSGPRLWMLAASLALVVGLGGSLLALRRELRGLQVDRERIAAELAATGRQLAELRAHAATAMATLQLAASPGTVHTPLGGLGAGAGATGQTYFDPQRRQVIFFARDLPPLAGDRTYQLWAIAGGRPISAGVLAVDAGGEGTLEVRDLPVELPVDAWAVTIEPAGGVPQPTGEMVLKS